MPVTLEFPDSRIIRLVIVTPWTVEELQSVYPKMQEYFDSVTEKIFTIVNLNRIGGASAQRCC